MIYKAFDKGIRDLSALQDAAKDVIENSFLQQVTVIAKNQKGLKKIYELITTSHTITFNKKKKQPMIPLSKLIADRENILIGSSFRNSPL
ncbi:MAG: hypothetical protein DRP42_03550 [Tenericutes bacterium]|nr:MAG: hypothetical protein DRP42_03550 [Mycoplasmatota bacterium]